MVMIHKAHAIDTSNLINQLLDAGIIQFGRFRQENRIVPFRFIFDYLTAYPELLSQIATVGEQRISGNPIDRLIAAPDSMALGVAFSLKSGVPLVYSKGIGGSIAHDLVGAYDSGHSTILVTMELLNTSPLESLIKNCEHVGLRIQGILTLLNFSTRIPNLPVLAILDFADVIHNLTKSGMLPRGQADEVLMWLATNLRQGEAAP